MHDRLTNGRKIPLLTIVDTYSRECLAIEVARSFKSEDVVNVLRRVTSKNGVPKSIRCDNGTEFTATQSDRGPIAAKSRSNFSRPGKPTQNAFVESFNGKFRGECLNENDFSTLTEARSIIAAWDWTTISHRPHSVLGNRTLQEFVQDLFNLQPSPLLVG